MTVGIQRIERSFIYPQLFMGEFIWAKVLIERWSGSFSSVLHSFLFVDQDAGPSSDKKGYY